MVLLETPEGQLGTEAPNFELKDCYGQPHTLESCRGEKGLLVGFICNHCPYVQAIIHRLVQDAVSLQSDGIGVVAIMSNDYQAYPDDAPPHMQAFSDVYHFSFPYLVDETQAVAKAYGAVCTPDFFGYDANMLLRYRGRLDSAGKGHLPEHGQKELLLAMKEIAQSGQTSIQQYPSMGCSIKWK